jgi:hypothetical protein
MIQAVIDFSPPCEVPENGTQQYQILEALKRGEYLTVADALTKYGVYALSQRCGELRRMGWPIVSQMRTLANGKRIAVYSMGSE